MGCFRFGCRKSPRASARSERAIRSSLGFYATLAHPFRSEGGVCLPRPPQARAWVAGSRHGCRKSPRASCTEREGYQEFPWLFMRSSRILFVWKEGWNMSGYPRWVSSDTSGELLLGRSEWRPVPHSIGVV